MNQNNTFKIEVQNPSTGEYASLQLPTNKQAVKELFEKLKIKKRYKIINCDFYIPQVRKAIIRSINIDEINYFASEYVKLSDDKKDRIRQILAAGCDTVDCVAEAINLIFTLDYSYYFLPGITTYEQVCYFHLACNKVTLRFAPTQYISRADYHRIGIELSHAERGKFFENCYIARCKHYYPDTYMGDIPDEYKVVPL